MEVDQYLSDPNQGIGILEFWQVVLIFMNCSKPISLLTCITIHRNINIDIPKFFILLWILYLSKPQVYPVNKSSH
jgi:hypothetical protein